MSIVPGRDVPAVLGEWVDAVNAAINNANHEDLCLCDGWPDACVSGYQSDRWDLGVSLTIAVGVLEPRIRERVAAEAKAARPRAPRKPKREYRFPGDAMSGPHDRPQL
jgi:hypothetical protein